MNCSATLPETAGLLNSVVTSENYLVMKWTSPSWHSVTTAAVTVATVTVATVTVATVTVATVTVATVTVATVTVAPHITMTAIAGWRTVSFQISSMTCFT
jgi:hypothetical protein